MHKLFLPLVVLMLLACSFVQAREKADEKARPLLKAAADRSLLHVAGNSPFKLKFTFEISSHIAKPMQGSYLWVRSETGNWRREIALSDFSQVEVGDGSTVWTKRSLDFLSLQAIWLEAVFHNHQYLNNPDDKIERYFTTSEHHAELRCVDLLRDKKPQTLCFDSHANLVKADLKELNMTFEYFDYQGVEELFVPQRVVLKREGAVVLEGTLERLPLDAKIASQLFEPPSGAHKRNGCLNPTPPLVTSNVQPEYPLAARNARQQGTVTVYARIASDGSPHDMRVLQTAGETLDNASLNALRNWQYEPAKCGSLPIDFDTVISVNFSLHY